MQEIVGGGTSRSTVVSIDESYRGRVSMASLNKVSERILLITDSNSGWQDIEGGSSSEGSESRYIGNLPEVVLVSVLTIR